MKTRVFCLIATFFAMMFAPSFQSSANAQSDNAMVDEFINMFRSEFMGGQDISVNAVGSNIEIRIVTDVNKGEPTAEFACDLVCAAKKYLTDNPSFVSHDEETMKYVDAFSAAGIDFSILFIDKYTNEKYSVALSPKEIVVCDIMNAMDSDEVTMKIMSYMPFEKFVKHLNSMLEEAGMVLEATGDYVYFVVPAPGAAEFQEVYEFYQSDREGFTEGFVGSFMGGMGEFAEMIHKFNHKIGVKITCPGYSPIVINVE